MPLFIWDSSMSVSPSKITYSINSFPDDNKERIIWWYGAVSFSSSPDSTTPEVEVTLKIINRKKLGKNRQLSEKASIHKIALAQLDLVRIGSIWKGRKQTGDVWDNFETHTFEFKFQKDQNIECIDCFDKVPGSNSHYISQDKYTFSPVGEKPDVLVNPNRTL